MLECTYKDEETKRGPYGEGPSRITLSLSKSEDMLSLISMNEDKLQIKIHMNLKFLPVDASNCEVDNKLGLIQIKVELG